MSHLLEEGLKIRHDSEAAMDELRFECGLSEAANMKQCLRVLFQRLTTDPQVVSVGIKDDHGVRIF